MKTRRDFLIGGGAGLCVLAAPLACFAQQQRSKVARIGLLEPLSASTYTYRRDALITGLRELGYVVGRNIIIEYRYAEGNTERLPGLATELMQMKLDIIVAVAGPSTRAAKQATTTIPIVMIRTGDPVSSGFVASLARPGGNITGLSTSNTDVSGKRLELLRVAVPNLGRVGVLMRSAKAQPGHPNFVKSILAAARTYNVRVSTVEANTLGEIEAAFGAIRQERVDALMVLSDPFFQVQTPLIAKLAAQQRLATMFSNRDHVDDGGFMSYGQDPAEHYYRAATYIDKILKGAKPTELPVEQPTKFELVINLKTAKAIGLTIPQELLFRADKVIE